jgi:hypothetical protein
VHKALQIALFAVVAFAMTSVAMTARASAEEGYFYAGDAGGTVGPFHLLGGRYFLDVWARYPYVGTPSASCLFTGLLEERTGTYQTVSIGNLVELSADMMPFHYATTLTLPSGDYVFHVASATDCKWTADIVTASDSQDPPGLAPLEIYEKNGSTFTRTTTLPISSDADFQAEYRAPGADKASISAKLQIIRDGKTIGTFAAIVGKDPNGADIAYQDLHWDPNDKRYSGALTAKLVVKVGSQTFTSVGTFTLTPSPS